MKLKRTALWLGLLALVLVLSGCAPTPASKLGRIAFQIGKFAGLEGFGFTHEIHVMNADGTGLVSLTNDPAEDYDPAWSPDRKRIAFHSGRDGNAEIYVMNADGTGVVRLTNNPAWDRCPAWSPDGEKIAFASGRDGNLEIYVMNADGTGQVRLTNNPLDEGSPAWSW